MNFKINKEMKEMKEKRLDKKGNKGITLVALAITMIILLILAGVSIATLTDDDGILAQAGQAKEQAEKKSIEEQIEIALISLENFKFDTDKEKLEALKNKLNIEGAEYEVGSKSMVIKTKQDYMYTVLFDETFVEGRFAYLDIADGTIELYENGYKQNNGELITYNGDYVITGTTTENVVRVMEKGIYNITIKDLHIDVKSSAYSAFNASGKSTGTYVTITLKGKNYLQGGNGPGLGFAGAKANINGITNGSTLTIEGSGSLEVRGLGNGYAAAGIGSSYSGGDAAGEVNNIIINSGNITAIGKGNACGIGGAPRGNVNNIIINGGTIYAKGGNRAGIGADGKANNIVINGGNITAEGGEYNGAIGGGPDSGKMTINGGMINAKSDYSYAAIGHKCSEVEITGGTIIANAPKFAGISTNAIGTIKITGGSIYANGTMAIGKINENDTLIEAIATDGENDLYLTQIQLKDVTEKIKISSITTSDNIDYGIHDIYTFEDGTVYLYLPKGSRTITINVNGKTYSGTVETTEEGNVVTLN